MSDVVFFVLMWGAYAAWLALFVWLAWTGRFRLLLALGAAMLLMFTVSYALVQKTVASPAYDHSGDMGYGLLILGAAAALLVPLALAAIIYPVGRLWAR